MLQLSKNNKRNIKWFIGILITVLGASGGIVEILKYSDIKKHKEEKEYQVKLREWENFSPKSLSLGVQDKKLLANAPFNLEKGHATTGFSNKTTDITFECWPQGNESLRASKGVSWSDQGVMNFEKIKYRQIRDAKFISLKHKRTKHLNLFFAHKSSVPGIGHVFFIKTVEGNVAIIQIVGYISNPNPNACRIIKLKYEVFPIVKTPPKPKK